MAHSTSRPLLGDLRGNFTEGNFGDDALLLANSALLTKCLQGIKINGQIAYEDDRLTPALTHGVSNRFDEIVVYGGGTQFFSFDEMQPATPHRSSLFSDLRKFISPTSYASYFQARSSFSRLLRAEKIAIGMGVGPFNDRSAAETAAALLRTMRLVWVRDALSEEFCRCNGVPNLIASSDLCFTGAFTKVTNPRFTVPGTGDESKVAIVLRDWEFLDKDFFQRQLEVAKRLRKSGNLVRLVSFSRKDLRFLEEAAAAGEEVLTWEPRTMRLEDFWEFLGEQSLIITSRFHGAVFALLSGTPFIAIEIEPKLTNLRSMVPELSQFAISPESAIDIVCSRVDEILRARVGLLPVMERALSVQRNRARIGEVALAEYFSIRSDS